MWALFHNMDFDTDLELSQVAVAARVTAITSEGVLLLLTWIKTYRVRKLAFNDNVRLVSIFLRDGALCFGWVKQQPKPCSNKFTWSCTSVRWLFWTFFPSAWFVSRYVAIPICASSDHYLTFFKGDNLFSDPIISYVPQIFCSIHPLAPTGCPPCLCVVSFSDFVTCLRCLSRFLVHLLHPWGWFSQLFPHNHLLLLPFSLVVMWLSQLSAWTPKAPNITRRKLRWVYHGPTRW